MESSDSNILELSEFLQAIKPYPPAFWFFRGQADESWPLRPKAGREDYFSPRLDSWTHDLTRFQEWRAHAVAFSDSVPEDDFECLAFAQHYGLATRLLDWTKNPVVALYFAVEKDPDKNGAVYAFWPSRSIWPEGNKLGEVDYLAAYKPRPFDRRLLTQSAVFTYHPKPEVPMTASSPGIQGAHVPPRDLEKVIIRSEAKPYLLDDLEGIGVTRKMMFPDLEGLAAFVNWQTKMGVTGRAVLP